jgi:hypothetical protein
LISSTESMVLITSYEHKVEVVKTSTFFCASNDENRNI